MFSIQLQFIYIYIEREKKNISFHIISSRKIK